MRDQEGERRVIGWASRILNWLEENYHPHKQEFLALKFVVSKFYDYQCDNHFEVWTDNNLPPSPTTTYVFSSAKLEAAHQRCVATLISPSHSIVVVRISVLTFSPCCVTEISQQSDIVQAVFQVVPASVTLVQILNVAVGSS